MINLDDKENALEILEKEIGYQFTDRQLLQTAFTHSSYANENKEIGGNFNERLEFLGDAVVDLVVSEVLYSFYLNKSEGFLTKTRSQIVCESSFAQAARVLGLERFLLLGRGEDLTGGRYRDSILADLFEAFCGALYLDGGYSFLFDFLQNRFKEIVSHQIEDQALFIDYKTMLQEHFHKTNKSKIRYKLEREIGPDHNKKFYMQAVDLNKVIGSGCGNNKKEAEQSAAKDALERIGVINV